MHSSTRGTSSEYTRRKSSTLTRNFCIRDLPWLGAGFEAADVTHSYYPPDRAEYTRIVVGRGPNDAGEMSEGERENRMNPNGRGALSQESAILILRSDPWL